MVYMHAYILGRFSSNMIPFLKYAGRDLQASRRSRTSVETVVNRGVQEDFGRSNVPNDPARLVAVLRLYA
jgi:hypothetical protein